MSEPVVLCAIEDRVATLTLNRPERMNAFTWQLGNELDEHLAACDDDDEVRAIVVTGAGRAFCAGADMGGGEKTFEIPDRENREQLRPAAPPNRREPWEIRKPIIAAINGPAIGVGLTLPLRYDLRIVARDAKLAFAFVRRGIVPELSSTWILPRLVGIARAQDLLLSGRTFLGGYAAEIGLANEAVEKEQVLPRALEIAREIATWTAPASVALTKRMVWRHLGEADPTVAAKNEARTLAWLGSQPDAKEGVVSFLQKREPTWTLTPKDGPEDR